MGTFSQANIKSDFNSVLTELKKNITIGREIWLDMKKDWFYNLQHDENSSLEKNYTIILSKDYSKEWIEIEFDFQDNLYLFDEILRRISGALKTEILLGYYQSTSGDGRLAKFKNGQMELSFYEKHYYYKFDDSKAIDRIYVADNFGVFHSKIPALKNSILNEDSKLIDIEFIYEFYKSEGWINDLDKNYTDRKYLHLEQLKFWMY